jgi:septum formation protein
MISSQHTIGSGFWLLDQPLLLASASVTRRDMLLQSGLPVVAVPADIDERAIEAGCGHSGAMVAGFLARAKSLAISARSPHNIVLGADQTLRCGQQSFHKPADRTAARAQLLALAGREHELASAFCLTRNGQVVAEGLAVATMTMRALGPTFLDRYLDVTGSAALSSVGCYQIEGHGSQLFEKVEGDHFTILGLPLLQVLAALRRIGALAE